ncbi:MAG TPA: M23 family metallopeptidase [Acidobacteriota bacterium]|nr:M23 family metallopeptidase [Acidobacteriota bacterium]
MTDDSLKSGLPLKSVIFILALVLLAAAAQGFFCAGSLPDIQIEPAMSAIGMRTPVTITVSETRRGLTFVKVELVQGNNAATVAEKSYAPGSQFMLWGSKTVRDVLHTEMGRKTLPGLKGGPASIRVTAGRANTWLRHPAPIVEEVILPVRLIPPSLQVTSTKIYVNQGGCELVTYRVGEPTVRDGVRSGSWWFPGYPLPGGGRQDRFAFFAVPYDMPQPDVRLIAEDAAGNSAERSVIDKFFPKPFKSDKLEINDSFINKVVPEILSQSPEITDRGNPLDNYLAINRELRQKNSQTILALAQKSKPAFLWNSPFEMMRNGKVMAAFADRRTYIYQGREIDRQDHLGFDLAVTKQAPIPAANSGTVLYARYFGIYGNAVVIDHGYGLQTIYGHLSSIAVKEGQQIVKGAILGNTGETGLAGGDHLHYCTLLQGLPVNPVEWRDAHWIRDRIARKLGGAFQFRDK